MPVSSNSRRNFLKTTSIATVGATVGVAAGVGGIPASAVVASQPPGENQRLRIGSIGMRYQGSVIALKAQAHGDIVAICDVDRHVREQARAAFGSTPAIYEDYREMLARDDIDVVTIGAPDHWHAKMLVDACRAGKDVYCEKPITLTVDEGKVIRQVVQETGRVVQVGSWQRSDQRFRLAVEMVRQGRLGKLQSVEVVLGKNPTGGPYVVDDPPPEINWDLWQGPAPDVPYLHERCHYTFRWWYEYAGGEFTDTGAHHIDIAQWGIGEYPIEIDAEGSFPEVENGYNVATGYHVVYKYPSGVVMTVLDHGRDGVMFTGSEGRIFVNRGTLSGKPVEDLQHNPLPREEFQVYEHDNLERPARAGKLDAIVNHMGNFFDCIRSRNPPVSDAESQHRSATTCHLGNIGIALGRPLKWDPDAEQFLDDAEANARLTRQRRAGYEM